MSWGMVLGLYADEAYLWLQDSEKYVDQLLVLFNRFSLLVKEAFVDDPRFLTARDKVKAVTVITR